MDHVHHQEVEVKSDSIRLQGELAVPPNAMGLVIFSHGSGSSRFSPRNNFVARYLHSFHLATFLFDLLTREEDQDYQQRFNIPLLSERLERATVSLRKHDQVKRLPIGYFGASTGAASALIAASKLSDQIATVVSRGGRPDMAMDYLPHVKCPTLLIVGELDTEVIILNQKAFSKLTGVKKLEIVKGATHLFEEPGTLEEVARLSAEWFEKQLKNFEC